MATSTLIVVIGPDQAGQRLDNFLKSRLKGLPKSRLYRALRSGEVRVNRRRVKPSLRLQLGDQVRLPPLRLPVVTSVPLIQHHWLDELSNRILFENNDFMVVDKPAGVPVHGGSGLNGGLIEAFRQQRPQHTFLELVHRLDRETSGCLLIAKKRRALLYWHQLLLQKQVVKQYLALVRGHWSLGNYRLEAALRKNVLLSGERMVTIDVAGKAAVTTFRPLCFFENATLLEVTPLTGRTHQIRVHAAHLGYPLAGDKKYGDRQFNQQMREYGLKRLFLHAASISSKPRLTDDTIAIGVVLAEDLKACLARLTQLSV